MPRASDPRTKVHFKGQTEDFIVFVESPAIVKTWREDSSTPLVDVVNGFKIFVTHKHGAQGTLDTASNATLENEFGTKDEDEIIKRILKEGSVQEVDVSVSILYPRRRPV